jgi:16S rRNA (uracil1498-N3)-methyltransferase
MDQVLTQSAELGVASVHPIITERSVVIPDKDSTPDKWITRLKEACKQAHNPFFPEIHNPKSFEEAVDYPIKNSFTSLFGSTDGKGKTLTDIKCGLDIAWFVGPEGGFSGNEVDLMLASGFYPITIGRYTMRVETACIVGIAVIRLMVVQ